MSPGDCVWINGQIAPAAEATVSVFDRSFLYGDALFETIRWANGNPFRWQAHLDRLAAGAKFLGIRIPFSRDELRSAAAALTVENKLSDGLVRIHLTRGIGRRGYSPAGADSPGIIISTHPLPAALADAPARWTLKTSPFRVAAGDPLAGIKSANKLLQIAARADAEANGFDDALLLNTDGFAAESSTGNVFWIEGGGLHTPPEAAGILPGVTRSAVIEIAQTLKIPAAETDASVERLKSSEGVFLTMSGSGLIEITRVDQTPIPSSPLTAGLYAAYRRSLASETA